MKLGFIVWVGFCENLEFFVRFLIWVIGRRTCRRGDTRIRSFLSRILHHILCRHGLRGRGHLFAFLSFVAIYLTDDDHPNESSQNESSCRHANGHVCGYNKVRYFVQDVCQITRRCLIHRKNATKFYSDVTVSEHRNA
ncbi:Uncharacterized protein APZ42_001014 [Daphnia magna]|uniref:Uncharacterized protein n=1 Tax=Daphnia magna TaxID=35525 RepID=A0A164J849_9CRUS|nr:Uncharacterized protein APZ42_001014 [Daphnia magna]